MAGRRMFSAKITESDAFTDMPLSSQALYFHLGMHADDDGFVGSPNSIQRSIGSSPDDLNILKAKGFIMEFESGIVVIKHWKMNNYIQKDRYHETQYLEEKSLLFVKHNGAYTFDAEQAEKPALTCMYTECIQVVSKMDTESSLVKSRLGKSDQDQVPSLADVENFVRDNSLNLDANVFYSRFEQNGWKDDKGNPVRNWKAIAMSWGKEKKKASVHKIPQRIEIVDWQTRFEGEGS